MTAETAFLGAGETYLAYLVTGEFTDVQVTLRMGIDALDLIRSRGDRIGPVCVCHAHGLVHILVDPDQAAGFDGLSGVLTAADVIDCGDHWSKAPYWIVPEGADAERVAPALLRTVLTGPSSRTELYWSFMLLSDEIRAVAVDFAGTLSTRERRRPNGKLVRRVLAEFDVPTDEQFATTFDTAMWRYYVESLPDSIPRLLQDLATAYGIELPNMTMLERAMWDVCGDHPVDDAGARAVRAQHEAGRVTLLASNTVRPAMYRISTLANAGLGFMRVVASSDIGVAKPDAGFYQRLIEVARVPAEAVLFVGDNVQNDVARPRHAGMQAAWVQKNRPADEPPVRLPDGTWVLSNLSQLTQILP